LRIPGPNIRGQGVECVSQALVEAKGIRYLDDALALHSAAFDEVSDNVGASRLLFDRNA